MAKSELVVALVALVVSAIALFIALTQLLADIFATAEGRRKTSPTVMGPFGRLTVRKRRWKELRYEVCYVSPRLLLQSTSKEEEELSKESSPDESRRPVEKDPKLHYNVYYELDAKPIAAYIEQVSQRNEGWQVLLGSLESQVRSHIFTATGVPELENEFPRLSLHEWAWDMLPDDTGKAIASTSLFDILVLARRLGAGWKSCEPNSDGLRAEGNGHVFVSTNLRGLGTAIAYQKVGKARDAIKRRHQQDSWDNQALHSWTIEADKFMFGIVPGNADFALPDFPIASRDALTKVWNHHDYLEIPWQRRKDDKDKEHEVRWTDLFKNKHGVELRHTTNDLIALASPWFRPHARGGIPFRQVLPFSDNFENMFQGFGDFELDRKGRQRFLALLEQEPGAGPNRALEEFLLIVRDLANADADPSTTYRTRLDQAMDGYYLTTQYFKANRIKADDPNHFYWHLMRAHLSKSPFIHADAMKTFKQNKDLNKLTRSNRTKIRIQQVQLLWENIDHFQHFMKNEGYDNADLVKEAWIVLFVRGMCWSLCHASDVLGIFIPIELYASQMPIFLL